MRARERATVVMAVLLLTPVLAAGSASAASPRVTVVAEGLDEPRGIEVDAAGVTYVTESGTGGEECRTEGEGDEEVTRCFGATSRITRIGADGTVDRDFITGLPSADIGGEEFVGASDVSVAPDGTLYAVIGLGLPVANRDEVVADVPEAALLGTLVRLAPGEEPEVVADLAAFEDAENPDGAPPAEEGPPDSNPDAVLATDDTIYVADAGGNTVLEVDPDTGAIEVAAIMPTQLTPLPPQFGGGEIPAQSVPTSLAQTADGSILVGELTGFPFAVDGARVYALTDDPEAPEVVEEGFTNIMGVAERGDELFVLEFTRAGLLSGDPTGALVRVRADGSRVDLLTEHLQVPGGMALAPSGAIHISNGAVFPGGGQVLAFDASPPSDAAIDLACPPGAVPSADLSDVAGSVHLEAIDCTAWFGIFLGFEDGTFGPSLPITRSQFASTVARTIEATGTELPSDGPTFPDVRPGSTHEAAIRGLAAADVIEGFSDGTYRPGQSITRAQATSLLVRAYEYVTGEQLPPGPDAWEDDDGSVHEDAIDAATQAGWIQGLRTGGFGPQRDITRAQVASVLARMASTLVGGGHLELPTS